MQNFITYKNPPGRMSKELRIQEAMRGEEHSGGSEMRKKPSIMATMLAPLAHAPRSDQHESCCSQSMAVFNKKDCHTAKHTWTPLYRWPTSHSFPSIYCEWYPDKL